MGRKEGFPFGFVALFVAPLLPSTLMLMPASALRLPLGWGVVSAPMAATAAASFAAGIAAPLISSLKSAAIDAEAFLILISDVGDVVEAVLFCAVVGFVIGEGCFSSVEGLVVDPAVIPAAAAPVSAAGVVDFGVAEGTFGLAAEEDAVLEVGGADAFFFLLEDWGRTRGRFFFVLLLLLSWMGNIGNISEWIHKI